VPFDARDQRLIRYSAFVGYWRKWEYNGTVRKLFIDYENGYKSDREKKFSIISMDLVYP
jgi:hypothetical protein